ncbi:TPA: hypothetical protein ACMDXH_004630 [Vibrio parahaemolyticus]|uniref:hypothetical protein n=1 Tax=Vibrio parahaemolyticus TaxID=670 RepID=UPI0023618801|nr:hypothetical protein [Vibrio parahaemolyticus]EJC6860313.1 hypothetical protein [Vibrio parahaemolyticus]EJG1815231.1 hypothetical protein [Vibrio parahaemolyticus]ELA9574404.1 hypothetical protein [Vibrio parahaemolyticus]
MDMAEFFRQYLAELSGQLKASNLYLTIFAALLGAVVGVLLTVLVSIFSGFLRKLSYNKSTRIQLHQLAKSNIMRCQVNIGILQNEITGLSSQGKFTLNGLALLQDYEHTLLYAPANFRPTELFLIRMQITALNSHHAQLTAMLEQRARLDIEIRKAPSGQQEMELTGLRLEYDQHLNKKFSDIREFSEALRDYLELGSFKRFVTNFIPLKVVQNKSMEAVTEPFTNN